MRFFCHCVLAVALLVGVGADVTHAHFVDASDGVGSSPLEQESIQALIMDSTAALAKLNINLAKDIDEANLRKELLTLAIGAQELVDPKTGKPYRTKNGNALPYWVFEPQGCRTEEYHTVLFIGGVHADEPSAIYTSLRALQELTYKPSRRPANVRLVYVPLLNPDGLLVVNKGRNYTTRSNGDGIDLNRNMMLKDSSTEAEDRFLKQLIAEYQPTHIVTLHAPFGWLDYDGPADERNATPELKQSVHAWLEATSRAGRKRLPINDAYPAIKGSMGDYGSHVLGVHVLTIELPHDQAKNGPEDWYNYGDSVIEALHAPNMSTQAKALKSNNQKPLSAPTQTAAAKR